MLVSTSRSWNWRISPRRFMTRHSIAKAIRNIGVMKVSTTAFQSMCGPKAD